MSRIPTPTQTTRPLHPTWPRNKHGTLSARNTSTYTKLAFPDLCKNFFKRGGPLYNLPPAWIVPSPLGVGGPLPGVAPEQIPNPNTPRTPNKHRNRIYPEPEHKPNINRAETEPMTVPMTVDELRRRRRALGCTWPELARALALIGVEVSPSTLRGYTDRIPEHVARALQRIEAMHRATGRIPGQAYPDPPPLPYDCRI